VSDRSPLSSESSVLREESSRGSLRARPSSARRSHGIKRMAGTGDIRGRTPRSKDGDPMGDRYSNGWSAPASNCASELASGCTQGAQRELARSGPTNGSHQDRAMCLRAARVRSETTRPVDHLGDPDAVLVVAQSEFEADWLRPAAGWGPGSGAGLDICAVRALHLTGVKLGRGLSPSWHALPEIRG